MVSRLAQRITRRPGIALVICLAVTLIAGGVGASAPVKLADAPGSDFADPAAETWTTMERLNRERADEGVEMLAVVDLPARWPSAAADKRVGSVVRKLESIDGINTVTAPVAPGPGIDGAAVAATASLVDKNLRGALITITFDKEVDGESFAPDVVEQFADWEGVSFSGYAVVSDAINSQVSEDLANAEKFAFPLLFMVSLWVFRSLFAALMPLVVGGVAIMLTFAGLVAFDAIEPMSIFAINLVFALSLGLAVDYSLLIISRTREARALGHEPRAAVLQAVRGTATTVVVSALTVAASLAALTVFPQRFLWSMGVGGIISALVAAVVSLTLLPALLALLGDRLDSWQPKRWRAAAVRDAQGTSHGFWGTIARSVMRRPLVYALVVGGILIAAASPVARMHFTGVDATVLPSSNPARATSDRIDRDFPLAASERLTVVADGGTPADLDRAIAKTIESLPVQQQRILGPVTQAAYVNTNENAGNTVGSKNAVISSEIGVRVSAASAAATSAATDLRDGLAQYRYLVGVSGPTTETIDTLDSFAEHAPAAIAIAAIATYVLVFLFTGSVVLPLKAILMNTLSVMIALAMLVLVFQDGRFEDLFNYSSQGGVEASQPLLIIAIAFGLSTDYGIMLLGRIREERERGLDDSEAVAVGIQRTGRIITSAALLLSIALGAFVTSQIVFIQQIGVGTVTAVLIDATIVRAILVPSLMALLGRWNWWAPRPLAALHQRFGIREVHAMSPPASATATAS
jgi:uncharacterized membrane protein YdfJ with MMPL/SSD domain